MWGTKRDRQKVQLPASKLIARESQFQKKKRTSTKNFSAQASRLNFIRPGGSKGGCIKESRRSLSEPAGQSPLGCELCSPAKSFLKKKKKKKTFSGLNSEHPFNSENPTSLAKSSQVLPAVGNMRRSSGPMEPKGASPWEISRMRAGGGRLETQILRSKLPRANLAGWSKWCPLRKLD